MKTYAQVAAILPLNNVNWEMLHWFLKFLKLKVKDPDQDKLDELLNSVDLSTYGLDSFIFQGSRMVDPVVLRPSRSRCACATYFKA